MPPPLRYIRGGDDVSFKGRKNIYRCAACGGETITVDVDDGTTPMLLACRASGDIGQCKGRAVSAMYEVDPDVEPAWEWYLPSLKNARRKGADVLAHVQLGGLLLRAISGANGHSP